MRKKLSPRFEFDSLISPLPGETPRITHISFSTGLANFSPFVSLFFFFHFLFFHECVQIVYIRYAIFFLQKSAGLASALRVTRSRFPARATFAGARARGVHCCSWMRSDDKTNFARRTYIYLIQSTTVEFKVRIYVKIH